MNKACSGGRRIAFFGGSFDPPHLGHLAVACAARDALGLDRILFAPVGAQPLKPVGSTASFADRVAMTRLAIAGERGLEMSLADAPKPTGQPNYTVETLTGLQTELGTDCGLYCLMGADSLAGLRMWHRAAEIPFVAPLIVASRPGQPLEDLRVLLPSGLAMEERAEPGLPDSGVEVRCFRVWNEGGMEAALYLLPGLDYAISASEIRAQMRAGEAGLSEGSTMVPRAVAEYIAAHRLY
jgi:nicotinate-nucleotide adenylyltransferase